MKTILVCVVLLFWACFLHAQSYNSDKVAFTNFLVRMYNNEPFEGVRVVDDYDNAYLISVLALDKAKYKTESVLNRVASVKAMAQASRYFNGSNITQDMIIRTSEKSDGSSDTEIIENIRENSLITAATYPPQPTARRCSTRSRRISKRRACSPDRSA